MKRLFVIATMFSLSLWGYSDFDLDGVDDTIDRCPNTSMTELVDMHGCTIKNLEGDHHFDVIVGASYSQVNPATEEKTDTLSTAVQADYYYKNFSLQVSTAYFNSESSVSSSGQTDSFVGAYYQLHPVASLSLRLGGGLLLPTYDADNNNLDYTASASLSYLLNNINLFGSYSYTLINDADTSYLAIDNSTVELYYQDTRAFNAGIGFYPSARFYTSLSYNQSDSVYEKTVTTAGTNKVDPLQSLSLYLFYTIDKNWFATGSYAYGLSDSASDHFAAIRLGYYF